tara:strand:- start:669 stop:1925 length:1257 start_codon:yes stop_codon:yes gene_type:complete
MKKILVIEDEIAIRETITEILQLYNYKVINAEDGEDGFQKAVLHNPDLVICDMMMPRMDGIDTINTFREHTDLKYIPFVFLSALNTLSDIRKGMNLGADDYLPKPFKPKELLFVIDLQFQKLDDKLKLSESMVKSRFEVSLDELRQKLNVSEQNHKNGLKFAGKIQSLILPKSEELDAIFPNNFIFYKPKYSVSGDFYWIQDFGDSKLIAVADCTGHGVAASLLTICCYNALNIAVKHHGLRKPKDILEKVNEFVLDFMQEHSKLQYEWGMDILICSINQKDKTVMYSGAKRPLYMVTKSLESDSIQVKKYNQDKVTPLYKLRASSFTIGSSNKNAELREETIKYNSGDTIYLSSDGYGDQFGGPSNKCFKSLNLIKLLLSIQNESMGDQKKILVQTFKDWKGSTEQTDDVTLLGIKL